GDHRQYADPAGRRDMDLAGRLAAGPVGGYRVACAWPTCRSLRPGRALLAAVRRLADANRLAVLPLLRLCPHARLRPGRDRHPLDVPRRADIRTVGRTHVWRAGWPGAGCGRSRFPLAAAAAFLSFRRCGHRPDSRHALPGPRARGFLARPRIRTPYYGCER